MEKKLYLGLITKYANCIEEVEILKEVDSMYMLNINKACRSIILKTGLNTNLEEDNAFEMFSESKECLIKQMREYASVEIEKLNKHISDLQSGLEMALNEN